MASRAYAASLLAAPVQSTANVDGAPPCISDILRAHAEPPPDASRCQPAPVRAVREEASLSNKNSS